MKPQIINDDERERWCLNDPYLNHAYEWAPNKRKYIRENRTLIDAHIKKIRDAEPQQPRLF